MKTYRTSMPMIALAGLLGATALAAPAFALSFVAAQSPGEQSTSSLVGLKVENAAGEALGDINYFVIDSTGKITTVVVGVGGFLGVAEKNVGVPYANLTLTTNKDGKSIGRIDATKDSLTAAPAYVWSEKSTAQRLKEGAEDLAKKAKDGAADLADKAKKAADDLQKPSASP
ncbi:MAG: PRC-barrel domain-containing protein [Hyphomicrobium sp.]